MSKLTKFPFLTTSPRLRTVPSASTLPSVTSTMPTLGMATDAVPDMVNSAVLVTYVKFRLRVVNATLPALKLLLIVMSRLTSDPSVMTRPFLVAFPSVTLTLPMLGMAAPAVPRMVNVLVDSV